LPNCHIGTAKARFLAGVTLHFRSRKNQFAERFIGKAPRRTWITDISDHHRCTGREQLSALRGDFGHTWVGLNPTTTSIIYLKEAGSRKADERDFQPESRYFCHRAALQGFHSVLFSTCRWATGGFQ
jgi:hypothetical protein